MKYARFKLNGAAHVGIMAQGRGDDYWKTPAGAFGAVKVRDVIEITIEGIGTLRNQVVGG
jgi:2-keto-4-pentenoate hydratase/2-oxohepta-3-ene-1,7-dioic acid hydratase in catechol pathway